VGSWAVLNECGEQKILCLHGRLNRGTFGPWRVTAPTAISRSLSCGVVLLIRQIRLSLQFIGISHSTVRRYISCDID